jgi:soluble P-type ATPase
MIELEIPGRGTLQLEHLVLDYNGTIAVDGALLDGVGERLQTLADRLTVHVVTADTFGAAAEQLEGLPCQLTTLVPGAQDQAKLQHVQTLGVERCVCVGNGFNDALMLEAAALGICVVLGEGASAASVRSADVVCTSINAALDLLEHPLRLTATLRS